MVIYHGSIPKDLYLDKIQELDFIEVFEQIDSTNIPMRLYLESLSPDQCAQTFHGLICADQQTAGRGRQQRLWWSPAGKNTYTTFGFSLPKSKGLHGLSLVVGLALRDTIVHMTGLQNVAIKWPNDVYIADAKLAGILIETFQRHGYWQIIIGIGVNVNQTKIDPKISIGQPWTSLALEAQCEFHRGQFITQLCKQLHRCIMYFDRVGWSGFQQRWQEVDWLYGQEIVVHGQPRMRGKASGVDQQGLLKVKNKQGVLQVVISGEVSVRLSDIV